jgi:hypothetical protein
MSVPCYCVEGRHRDADSIGNHGRVAGRGFCQEFLRCGKVGVDCACMIDADGYTPSQISQNGLQWFDAARGE